MSKGKFDKETDVARALRHDEEAYLDRAHKLDKSAPDMESMRTPDQLTQDANQRHQMVNPNANFDQKVYMFPEEFNALRRELQENWPTFFCSVNPDTGISPAYAMVFDAPNFVGMCNGATDLAVHFDSGDVAGMCKKFLNAFRKMRGLSEIH